METIIKTNKINFHFGTQQVINNLSLEVPENSIYGFLGPNGAGKSTTIKLLLGLLKSNEENIFLFGKEFKANKNEILMNIGNLIESPTVYHHLTAFENLRYLNFIYKKKKGRIEEVLKIVGLQEQCNKKVKHFSTGMRQRLGIGMAIFHNPNLIILDEPVNGLDPKGVFEMRELLLTLQNEGKTIFISSHMLSEIEKLCTHVGIINKGKMLYQGTMQELISHTSKHVLIQTNDNLKAMEVLKQNQIQVIGINSEMIELKINNYKEFNHLISCLVSNQIEINDIEKISGSLEDIFITLTSN